MPDKSRLDELLQKFPSLHILVVGDFFLDKYLSLDPALSEISLETGLEAYQVVEIRHSPGAAGTVVSNLRALETQVSVVGVIGRDGEGFDLKQGLVQRGVNIEALLETPERFTPTYTKPMLRSATPGGSERELNRLDIKNRRPLPAELEAAVITQLDLLVPVVDGVVIADQVQERNCGIITDKVRAALARLAEQYPEKVFIVDSRVRIGEFERVIIKPNVHEARDAVGRLLIEGLRLEGWKIGDHDGDDGLAAARSYGKVLFTQNQKPVFVTLGAQGILVITAAGFEHVPGIRVSGEIDVVGAGDSVMAGVAAGLCAGGTATEAAFIGNMTASITIQQIGTTGTASREQLRQRYEEMKR
jgi:rfaE bifunctional protein kinase chain/domain